MEFSHPLWFLALLAIPLGWLFFYQTKRVNGALEKFIDKHLLPYLLLTPKEEKGWQKLLLWSLVWSCLTFALAGPRWDFREVETSAPGQSLVIALDLSDSMNAVDVKPSRLMKAKQKIADILNELQGGKVALIAFAADPHMITPLTDDKETILHLLRSLDSSVVYIQGSRLGATLEMAGQLLAKEQNKTILVLSDGGFEDTHRAITVAKKLQGQGVAIYAMGIGTKEGAQLKGAISRLEKEKLAALGHYLEPNEQLVLEEKVGASKKQKIWEEHFYLFILPALPVLLWWMRRGYLVPLFLLYAFSSEAYFKNTEEQGYDALNQGKYEEALQTLQDPYRRGVAAYRAQQFAEAEQYFRSSNRPEVDISARYNLGNALAEQYKLKEAISAYEDVLKKDPDHTRARENLELLKKMLEEQENKQDNNQQNSSNDQDKSEDQQPSSDDQDNSEQDNSEGEEESQEQDQKREQEQRGEEEAQSEEDQDADLWLNQIQSDPKYFLKNKFYIESKKNKTKEGIDPW